MLHSIGTASVRGSYAPHELRRRSRRRTPRAAIVHPHVTRPSRRRRDRIAAGAGVRARQLGKTRPADRPRRRCPARTARFPGTDRIELATEATGPADAVVLLECSEITRPEVAGLDRYFVINVDHHLGNEMYGAVNWFDSSAAACGEMVADIIDALGVPWTRDIAANLYLAIATDTGGFRYGSITRGHVREVPPHRRDRRRHRGTLAADLRQLRHRPRADHRRAARRDGAAPRQSRWPCSTSTTSCSPRCGATIDDTEGLVNLPLGAREVVAVALFKRQNDGVYRVSLRSKGDVDVRAVAAKWSGGGHKNAAGCTVTRRLPGLEARVRRRDRRQARVTGLTTPARSRY